MMLEEKRKEKIDQRECHGAAYIIGKWELGAYMVGLIWDFILGFIRKSSMGKEEWEIWVPLAFGLFDFHA